MKSLVISTFLMLLVMDIGATETPECTEHVQAQYNLDDSFSLEDLKSAMKQSLYKYPERLVSAVYIDHDSDKVMVMARWMSEIGKFQLEYLNDFKGPRFVLNLSSLNANPNLQIDEQNFGFANSPNGYIVKNGKIISVYSTQRKCIAEGNSVVCICRPIEK